MTKISIVIVNYNVKYFIRQCLQSIFKSQVDAELDVIVIDNNSKDGSVEMIRQEFPQVRLVDNKENVGFSKANNQGFEIARGDFILILNPDTIIEESTLQICLDYCYSNKDVGAIGVKMLDGSGQFLPESKRGFPTPLQSLFKLIGISKIFKSSARFNGYYLGHLSEDETHNIDVLTGAFMFIPTPVIQAVSGFDEDYFMYGEDIELSFQIKALGKKIIYLPDSSIIHFKGESTKKSSIQYLKNFYGAMAIYASKRHEGSGWIWNVILRLGIFITALVAVFRNVMQKILRPIIDLAILFGTTKLIQNAWASLYYKNETYYDDSSILVSTVFSIVVLISVYYVLGHYDKKYRLRQLAYSFVFSSFLVLSIYAIYPLEWRYSRIVLLTLLILTPFIFYLTRCLYHKIMHGRWAFQIDKNRRIAIVGSQLSYNEISKLSDGFKPASRILGRISEDNEGDQLGQLTHLRDIVDSRKINELIFCTKDIATEKIFEVVAQLDSDIAYKIASDDNSSILGSDSKDRVGEWYTFNINFKINQKVHQRTKRLIDLFVCIVAILLFPVILILSRQTKDIFSNWFSVFFGSKTWIGFNKSDALMVNLPQLKDGVFEFSTNKKSIETEDVHQENIFYARNYNIWMELEQIIKNLWK